MKTKKMNRTGRTVMDLMKVGVIILLLAISMTSCSSGDEGSSSDSSSKLKDMANQIFEDEYTPASEYTDEESSASSDSYEDQNYYEDDECYENDDYYENDCYYESEDLYVNDGKYTTAESKSNSNNKSNAVYKEAGSKKDKIDSSDTSSNSSNSKAASDTDIDSSHDYAEDAKVRTSVAELTPKPPITGATNATIKASVTNRKGGTITMIGCTVYDVFGKVAATDYRECSYTDSELIVSYDLNDDMDLILENDTYMYQFVVKLDGELCTHEMAMFRTNGVDDNFAFEAMPVQLTDTKATTQVKIYNPTGKEVPVVGCTLYTPQGAIMAEEEKVCNESGSEVCVSFDFDDDGEKLPSAKDYEYEFYIRYNGQTYESTKHTFTTLP